MRTVPLLACAFLAAQAAPLAVSARAQTTVPPLTYMQTLSPQAVKAVQEHLRAAGAYAGQADGVWGGQSEAALTRFQEAHGLQPTGALNDATAATLGLSPGDLLANAAPAPPPPAETPLSPTVVRSVQTRLRQFGFYNGQIDGIWGPSMQSALAQFQQGRGLQANGQLNPATTTALGLDPNNLLAQTPAPVR